MYTSQKSKLIKSVLYRATHRGSQEADKILGGFAHAMVTDFDEDQLHQFSQLLNQDDPVILQWLQSPHSCSIPAFEPLLQKLRDFYK